MENGGVLLILVSVIFIVLITFIVITILVANSGKTLHVGCSSDRECQEGLICSSGHCLIPIGGPCTESSQCQMGSGGCRGGVCVERGQTVGTAANNGCSPGTMEDGGICRGIVGHPCEISSQCASWTGGCRGGVCIANERRLNSSCSDNMPCNQGLECIEGICKIQDYSFIPCLADNQCVSENCQNGQCVN